MGCGSSSSTLQGASSPARGDAAGGSMKGQNCVPGTIEWCYFGLNGRGDPLKQMFEYHGQAHNKKAYEIPEWGEVKARGEGGEFGGGLPQVTIPGPDGKPLRMAQMGAILRSLGVRFGYYNPKDWKQSVKVDGLVDTYADVLGSMSKILFSPESDRPELVKQCCSGIIVKWHRLLERTLASHNGKFVAGNNATIADFIMASYINNNLCNPNCPISQGASGSVGEFPKLQAYVKFNQAEFKQSGPVMVPM